LAHYLQRLDRWQATEFGNKAKEIRARAQAEGRYLTALEAQQSQTYDREGIRYMLDYVLGDALRKWERETKQGLKAGRSPAARYDRQSRCFVVLRQPLAGVQVVSVWISVAQ